MTLVYVVVVALSVFVIYVTIISHNFRKMTTEEFSYVFNTEVNVKKETF